MTHNDMEIRILTAIAVAYPFPMKEITDAYDRLKSYDTVLCAVEEAIETLRPLSFVVDDILTDQGASGVSRGEVMGEQQVVITFGYDNERNQYVWTVCNATGNALFKQYLSASVINFISGDEVRLRLTTDGFSRVVSRVVYKFEERG